MVQVLPLGNFLVSPNLVVLGILPEKLKSSMKMESFSKSDKVVRLRPKQGTINCQDISSIFTKEGNGPKFLACFTSACITSLKLLTIEALPNIDFWQNFLRLCFTLKVVIILINREYTLFYQLVKFIFINDYQIVFKLIFRVLNAGGGLHLFPMLKDDFEQKLSEGCDSPYLLSFLVDFYDDNLEIYGKNEIQVKRVIEARATYF